MLCKHLLQIKKEKYSNNLQNRRSFDFCDLQSKDKCQNDVEKWFCLECGFVGCSRNSENQCVLKHHKDKKHKVVISTTSLMIWFQYFFQLNKLRCYECDDDIESIIELNKEECKDQDTLDNLSDKVAQIKETFYKSLQNQRNTEKPKTNTNTTLKKQSTSTSIPQDTSLPSLFGLRNLGNTCFFNSVMQSLYGLKIFVDHYLDQDDTYLLHPAQLTSSNINQKYKNFLHLTKKSKNMVDPSDLFKSIASIYGRYRGMAQQDAQELLRCFLDALSTGEEKALKSCKVQIQETAGKAKISTIENIFGSYLCNYLECLDCGHISRTFDFCLDYPIQIVKQQFKSYQKGNQSDFEVIPQEQLKNEKIPYYNLEEDILIQPNQKDSNSSNTKFGYLKLETCLDQFTNFEELNHKQNYFRCENCTKKGVKSKLAIRKFYIYEPPQVATIVLKRFAQKSSGRFEKIDEHVEIPESLDLSQYALFKGKKDQDPKQIVEEGQQDWKYQLRSVVVHAGSMFGGHYIAYVKHGNRWFYFSDSSFREVSFKNVSQTQAYILFYEKSK